MCFRQAAASMAQKAGRKTMNANDVMEAILDIDFPQFKEPMEKFLESMCIVYSFTSLTL